MKENYSHETFAPGFDPHGNHTKIEREEDLPIAGVNLVGSKLTDPFGSNEVSLKPMLTSPAPARMMMMASSIHAEAAEDETYALPADKGVVVQVIPDDQLPTDTEGNKAELLTPERRMSGLDGDFDYDMLHAFPPHAVIPVYAKPKTHINRQRQGYSRRKAKRAFQARATHQVKLTRYKRRGRGYLMLLDENGNPVNLKSDIHVSQFQGKTLRTEMVHPSKPEVGSFMKPTKPTPHGKGDLNG